MVVIRGVVFGDLLFFVVVLVVIPVGVLELPEHGGKRAAHGAHAEKRKGKNLTQAQLAERLNITDRAVSKWETGRSLPDSSVMVELCELLGITVNELLTGEDLEMKNYNE